jgi:hypothetical protein
VFHHADGCVPAMTIIEALAMQCRVIAKRFRVQCSTITWA